MTQDERLMILQMVADKKISATEAAELLRALEGSEAKAGQSAQEPPRPQTEPSRSDSPERPRRTTIITRSDGGNFGHSIGSFIEELAERFSSSFTDATDPRYEFPTSVSGEFAGSEVPLRIHTGNGKVKVRTWDQPGFEAQIMVRARGASEDEARRRAESAYEIRADERGFELTSRHMEGGHVSVQVTLSVPKGKRYGLDIRTGNGAVELDDLLLRESKVTSGNGRITCLGAAAEEMQINTGNGSIEAAGDFASLEVRSGNGSVKVRPTGARAQRLKLTTGNGSARVETAQLGADAGFRVEAHTGLGGISCNLPGLEIERQVRSMGHKQVVGQTANFNTAAVPVNIKVHTGLGSVTIE